MITDVNKANDFEYVGFWMRVVSALLDVLIMAPLAIIYSIIQYNSPQNSPFLATLSIFFFSHAFIIYFTVVHGGTLGKLIVGIRIIDENANFLTVQKSLLRLLPSIIYNILNISLGFFQTPQENIALILLNSLIYILFSVFTLVDVLFVPFTEKKRAIHDYMAGSFVVTKESLLKARNQFSD